MRKFFFGGRLGLGGCRRSGVWWVRMANYLIHLKAPRYEPLFSERYGFYDFRLSVAGWRLIGKRG